jgi:hypothetical protein
MNRRLEAPVYFEKHSTWPRQILGHDRIEDSIRYTALDNDA